MEKLLKVLKNNKYRSFEIMGSQMLEIVPETDFDYAQEGFRFNPIKNEIIEDWGKIIGDEYYVIGFETTMGDAILVNTNEEGLPVYTMITDGWSSMHKIADSFDEFISYLKELDERINVKAESREAIREFTQSLDEKNHTTGFYETLCFDILDEDGLLYDEYQPKK